MTPAHAKKAVNRNTADRIQQNADDARDKHRAAITERRARAKERLNARLRKKRFDEDEADAVEEKKKKDAAGEKRGKRTTVHTLLISNLNLRKSFKKARAPKDCVSDFFHVDFSKIKKILKKLQKGPADRVLSISNLRKIFKKAHVPKDCVSALIESIAFSANLKEGEPITVKVLSDWLVSHTNTRNKLSLPTAVTPTNINDS